MPASILVSGTSGFVGGALGRAFRAGGMSVIGVSRRPAREGAADRQLLHDLAIPLPADAPRADVVVHAAALASPWARPVDYRRNIVDATRHMLAHARRTGADHFVLISTTAVLYRAGDQFDLTEDEPYPETPINGYAAAKREAEEMVRAAWPAASILRPRAVYGPGDTVLFPRILDAARKRMLPRIVRTDGGASLADVVYIDNLVHAVEVAIERRLAGVVHVTDGKPIDTGRMLDDVLVQLGYPLPKLRWSYGSAMRIAAVAEWASRHLFGWREPPITRFGVSALTHCKTFAPQRMIDLIGPPPFSTADGIAAFVAWHKAGAQL
ncbi:NAD(P)-dependent oxidoreductase [Bradyrhizobium sp. U87765 SZCCT0131]|uniref:NAD-dependent epimerase/dehydratase family protein n=1 Tax=unclassified Bradyrhizobium TaxID=2631580 RepID=UPI001BA7E297|nr:MULTISPECIES: NAD(P)-dependent oxidoreductase [unclassified Bradyrhizobium]MBR1216364.1 NAD(P)-dependent oxidoreductase [Bradyrhizobium sp. U87765 SZCCT0131]MBR1259888.1 NAD(P)-dependent oxidoreductase [Bradyrhizobium sp. U87765 SZCCT0134]MBR1306021.1 NAD(P)-dependent oxidoreductase [Bradyrhizobium sp. U87765 SZCCT0110]MBR1322388.1 NAD(P)-dependent oxidoreductase [Bradyrhizobium sp. U87765 SZCCT0109]MBR1352321.1 NAD(P)-dependent oxidoreductase [Bradyrhizobium sp. U87765 SZCCT0048]